MRYIKYNKDGFAATVEIDEANGALKSSGTTNGTTASKLVNSGANFSADGVDVGDEVFNSTDSTYAYVTAVDSGTTLSLSADIFVSGEAYEIQAEMVHNITNSNMGSLDDDSLDATVNPVIPGENTFEKYQKVHVTAMGGSSLIDNLKIWRTSALGGAATHLTNARLAAYARFPYAAPTENVSTPADQTMPTAEPATANLGIDGSLAGSLAAVGYSDWLIHQIQTNVADVAGSTSTLNYQFDETA